MSWLSRVSHPRRYANALGYVSCPLFAVFSVRWSLHHPVSAQKDGNVMNHGGLVWLADAHSHVVEPYYSGRLKSRAIWLELETL